MVQETLTSALAHHTNVTQMLTFNRIPQSLQDLIFAGLGMRQKISIVRRAAISIGYRNK